MKKVLITGGNGNLGHLVAQRLSATGVEIVRFDLPGTEKHGPGAEVLGDIRDRDLMRDVFDTHQPDAIIHLASLLSGSSETDLDATWEINATASFTLMRLAQDRKLSGPFVFASTIGTYGPNAGEPLPEDAEQWPDGFYGATKVAVERMGVYFKANHGLDFRCLRFPLVFSPFAPASAVTAYPSHAFKAAADADFILAILPAVGFGVVVPEVRDVFQEQHHEDVVLVLRGIDGAAEGVAGGPCGVVHLVLGDLVGHQATSFWSAAFASSARTVAIVRTAFSETAWVSSTRTSSPPSST